MGVDDVLHCGSPYLPHRQLSIHDARNQECSVEGFAGCRGDPGEPQTSQAWGATVSLTS